MKVKELIEFLDKSTVYHSDINDLSIMSLNVGDSTILEDADICWVGIDTYPLRIKRNIEPEETDGIWEKVLLLE